LNGNPNGLIVCGPQTDSKLASAIVHLAEALHVPVLADPLSQLRTGDHSKSHVIATYDALFRDKKVRKTLKPDYVLRFGARPICMSYRSLIEENHYVMRLALNYGMSERTPSTITRQNINEDHMNYVKR